MSLSFLKRRFRFLSFHLVYCGFIMIIDSMTYVVLAPRPAFLNVVKVVQTSQLHACTFHLALPFILHGSAFGLSGFRCWCVKLRYACLTDTCVSPSQSNLAVDCASEESWHYMSGKERKKNDDVGGQTLRVSAGKADLLSSKHIM